MPHIPDIPLALLVLESGSHKGHEWSQTLIMERITWVRCGPNVIRHNRCRLQKVLVWSDLAQRPKENLIWTMSEYVAEVWQPL